MFGHIHRNEFILSGRDFVNIISNAISNKEMKNFDFHEYLRYNLVHVVRKERIVVKFHLNEWKWLLKLLREFDCDEYYIYGYMNKGVYFMHYEKGRWLHYNNLRFIPADEEMFCEFINHRCEYVEKNGLELQKGMRVVMSYVFKTEFMHLKNDIRRYCLARFGYEAKIK